VIEVGGKGDKRPKVDLESENRDVIFPQLSRKGGVSQMDSRIQGIYRLSLKQQDSRSA
jgi:hypothetical protein